MKIDINSDLGEGFGPWRMGDDETLLGIVSSANVACGHHAGDPMIMAATARSALARGVDLGAHVSFPDLIGFGRRPIPMSHAELEGMSSSSSARWRGLPARAGHRVTHLNAHGALGNLACADRGVAEALVRAVRAFDPDIALLVLSKTELEGAARQAGLRTFNLFLADRAYEPSGQLVPRANDGALIKNDAAVLARVRRVLEAGTIATHDGGTLAIEVHSILVHSDTPGAVTLARAPYVTKLDAPAGPSRHCPSSSDHRKEGAMASQGILKNPSAPQADPAIIAELRGIAVALISDSMHRNCGSIDLRPYHKPAPLAGTAVTVRTRGGDNLAVLRAYDFCRPGDVMVIDAGGDVSNAILGGIMSLGAEKHGLAGVVVDGAIRDVAEIGERNFRSTPAVSATAGLTKMDQAPSTSR